VILAILVPAMLASLYMAIWSENGRRELTRELKLEVECMLDLEARDLSSFRWTPVYRVISGIMDRRNDERRKALEAELRARPLQVGDRIKAIRTQTERGRGHPQRLVQASATLVAFQRGDEVRVVFNDSGREVTRSRVEVYAGLPAVELDDGGAMRTADPTD
jgi:hypothetical protein